MTKYEASSSSERRAGPAGMAKDIVTILAVFGIFNGALYGALMAYAGETYTALACSALMFQSWLLFIVARPCK